MKSLWIDLLCFSSAAQAVWLCYRRPVERVYFVNIHKRFKPFVGLLSRIIGKPAVQILDIVEAERRTAGVSLYEAIHLELTDGLSSWADSEKVRDSIELLIKKKRYNAVKYREHLKEAAYFLLFRPMEMLILAESVSGKDGEIFLLRESPLKDLVRQIYGKSPLFFYSPLFLFPSTIEKRKDYYFDKYVNDKYYGGTFWQSAKLLNTWMLTSIKAFKSSFAREGKLDLGVELIQGRVRLDDINDIYWLKDSAIDPASVCGLLFENYDAKSIEELSRTKIRLVRPTAGKDYFWKTIGLLPGLFPLFFSSRTAAWFKFQQIRYSVRVGYWESVYRRLGLKILWTMFDVDPDKLAKAQALEMVGGLYLGSHWSNFPMYRVDNQKCYDAVFTWGEHFISNNFNRYPFMAVFQTGYPSDHYFAAREDSAAELKSEFDGKFVISFQDNMIANDIPYSKGMQIAVHKMLIGLLNDNDRLALLLKPKRAFVFEQIEAELPELKRLMGAGRVRVFLGETARSKAVPAEIGMASDLVIGLGISTTAAECCFAGTVSFHADLTGFEGNAFGQAGLNKVVFRDIDSLKRAVQAQIDGRGMTIEKCREYHRTLDPYQDGQSYKRTGAIIHSLRMALRDGFSREEAVKKVQQEVMA